MNRVAWVISPPEKGSGGFRTICTKASYLDQHGFECHFFILPGSEAYKSSRTVAEQIYLWFGYKPKSVRVEHTIPCNLTSLLRPLGQLPNSLLFNQLHSNCISFKIMNLGFIRWGSVI